MTTKNVVGKFEKVSYDSWCKSFVPPDEYPKLTERDHEEFHKIYDKIQIPRRATIGSVGYDFFMYTDMGPIGPRSYITIPTGIKCKIEDGWGLFIFPKSGMSHKYDMKLADSVSVIDADYYNCESNEGQIIMRIFNHCNPIGEKNKITGKTSLSPACFMYLEENMSYCQGVFLPIGYAEEEPVTAIRKGGFGSTQAKTETPKSQIIV